jgi:hypothetical protein
MKLRAKFQPHPYNCFPPHPQDVAQEQIMLAGSTLCFLLKCIEISNTDIEDNVKKNI